MDKKESPFETLLLSLSLEIIVEILIIEDGWYPA